MDLRDLIVTPIVLIIVLMGGFFLRPRFTDQQTKAYFLPALFLKSAGAIALGFMYQFYYDGGDTFNYHTHGSREIWNALMDSPTTGWQLLFSDGITPETYPYARKILFISDPNSFFIVKIAAILDLFTGSCYTATAVLFSVFSFIGGWMLFITFYRKHPSLHRSLAIACLFIPSVMLWGSGILKDTIVLGCLGILTYEIDRIFIIKRISFAHVAIALLSIYCIFSVKKFVLQAFLPAALVWVYLSNLKRIKSIVARTLLLPIILAGIAFGAYFSVTKVGEGDKRYAIDKIANTAMITAYDIRYYTGKNAGSGYSLGELDGSFSSMLKLAPAAINVSLFRPYLWEVKNPLMLLSAIESLAFALFVVVFLVTARTQIVAALTNPDVAFCLAFVLTFAFAVGISTFNFGTLARYKVPMLSFFALALTISINYSKKPEKEFITE